MPYVIKDEKVGSMRLCYSQRAAIGYPNDLETKILWQESHFGTQSLTRLSRAATFTRKITRCLVATRLLGHHMQREQTLNIAEIADSDTPCSGRVPKVKTTHPLSPLL